MVFGLRCRGRVDAGTLHAVRIRARAAVARVPGDDLAAFLHHPPAPSLPPDPRRRRGAAFAPARRQWRDPAYLGRQDRRGRRGRQATSSLHHLRACVGACVVWGGERAEGARKRQSEPGLNHDRPQGDARGAGRRRERGQMRRRFHPARLGPSAHERSRAPFSQQLPKRKRAWATPLGGRPAAQFMQPAFVSLGGTGSTTCATECRDALHTNAPYSTRSRTAPGGSMARVFATTTGVCGLATRRSAPSVCGNRGDKRRVWERARR